jgi:hypothetical protein
MVDERAGTPGMYANAINARERRQRRDRRERFTVCSSLLVGFSIRADLFR